MKVVLTLAGILALASCAPQQPAGQIPAPAGESDSKLLSVDRNLWPGTAGQSANKPVAVTTEFVITPEGNVVKPRITSSNDSRFNDAALKVTSSQKFEAVPSGKNQPARKTWNFIPADLPSGKFSKGKSGSVAVLFKIGADGRVAEARAEKPGDPSLDRMAIGIVQQGKYPPAAYAKERAATKRLVVTLKD